MPPPTPTTRATGSKKPELPDLDDPTRRLLEADVLPRGVMVPILITQDGEVLDGRVRLAIAQRHKLTCPKIVVGRLAEDERADLRLAVNIYRRHLTQAQRRELVAWELKSEPEKSDRCVARKAGVNHRTVAVVRKGLEAGGEILHLPDRTGADGKRYPVVVTNGEPQARVAARLLDELGDDALPDTSTCGP